MNMQDIKSIAKKRGVSPGKMTKVELVQAIQSAEGNEACFGTHRAGDCGQLSCLWKEDCK